MEKKEQLWERLAPIVLEREDRFGDITVGRATDQQGKDNLLNFIFQELSKAREEGRRETLLEMQREFSEYGVPDDVRYTHSLFYINNIIEEKLSKLKDNK